MVYETFGQVEINDRQNDPQLSVKSHRTNPRDFDELSYIDEFENKKLDEMRRFVDQVIARGQPWTDPEFKPDITSLFDPANDEGSIGDFNKYAWKRLSEIYTHGNVFH